MATRTLVEKKLTGQATAKSLFDESELTDETLDGLKAHYASKLDDKKVYKVDLDAETVYYLPQAPNQEYNEINDDEGEEKKRPAEIVSPEIQAYINFRQYLRILRRFIIYHRIKKSLLRECTSFDADENKIHHRYYDDKPGGLKPAVSDRFAKYMNLDKYLNHYEKKDVASRKLTIDESSDADKKKYDEKEREKRSIQKLFRLPEAKKQKTGDNKDTELNEIETEPPKE